ncbi:MAG: Chromosome partition protein Smc [Candidatus Omnitrophica bacterium]|nr:Chromosome partition protein Smc [Candidatus Omnitrophota bacterium]
MHFKRLELIGFKSFADKTQIEFEQGVTAIVGPNGCGKSNVSDAIRWVLGEQSAKSLRGSHMEDVIFNGSADKEPLGLAEVSLTLSNEDRALAIDYDEVTITRRLYRSGDSEYLLNRNVVRLKDIHELLMGTGIGTDDYSVIEQGKMDRILNSKPEDRRSIFEEAAGITKFKSKKKEALRKLEQTEQNLLRVNDIIVEVKRQIGSIERQARKAEIYKAEFEKLKGLEIAVAGQDFVTYDGRKRERDAQLEELRSREEAVQGSLEGIEALCQDVRASLGTIEESLRAADAEELAANAEVRRKQDRVLLNTERIGELVERREQLLRQCEASRQRIDEYVREAERLRAELESVLIEEREGEVLLRTVEGEFNAIAESIRQAQEAERVSREGLQGILRRRADHQGELARIDAETATLTRQVESLRRTEAELLDSSRHADEALHAAQEEVHQAEQQVRAHEDRKAAAASSALAATDRIREIEHALHELSIEESSLRSRADFITDLKNRHEGFLGGVKAILASRESDPGALPGLIGPLMDLVSTDRGYELAAEAAFEDHLQTVVFETEEQVLAAVDYLRQHGRGRAVLCSVQGEDAATAAAPGPEGLERLVDRVRPEARVSGLVSRLLGSVYLAPDPRDAARLARQNTGCVFVTREGERFEGRTVRGGSLSQAAELTPIGREQRLRDVEVEIGRVQGELTVRRADLEAARAEHARLEEELRELAESIFNAQVRAGHARQRAEQTGAERGRVSAEFDRVSSELAGLAERETVLSGQQRAIHAQAAQLDAEESRLNDDILLRQAETQRQALLKEELLVKLAETRSRQEHRTARREKIQKDTGWVEQSAEGERGQLGLYEREAADCVGRREALESENAQAQLEIEELALRRDELLRRIETIRREREETASRLAEAEREKMNALEELNAARAKAHAVELESAGLKHEMDRLQERIYNAYNVDLAVQLEIARTGAEAAEAFRLPESLDLESAKVDIQTLRDKLAKMGPVNLVAIEEFEELKQRYDFLTQQHADLTQAKDDLHKAIIKINRTTRELFAETFQKVQQYFSEYFRLLFRGGQAELVLLDENDILESGIEIVARPPGKKLQTITLLSGGEKALTAVALLFSLFKVRPSPFCILDEIDAPLDETNVERFCSVLKDFVEGSQFILITHNKRTMNLADAMYGITMAQTGVSRVVSVKFGEKRARAKETEEVTAA